MGKLLENLLHLNQQGLREVVSHNSGETTSTDFDHQIPYLARSQPDTKIPFDILHANVYEVKVFLAFLLRGRPDI